MLRKTRPIYNRFYLTYNIIIYINSKYNKRYDTIVRMFFYQIIHRSMFKISITSQIVYALLYSVYIIFI